MGVRFRIKFADKLYLKYYSGRGDLSVEAECRGVAAAIGLPDGKALGIGERLCD